LLSFDPATVSFSCPGSYLAIATMPVGEDRPAGLYLRTVRGAAKCREVLRFELTEADQPAPARSSAGPAALRMETASGGWAEMCFESPAVLRIRFGGAGLRLLREAWRPFDHVLRRGEPWIINCYDNRLFLAMTVLAGAVSIDAPWERVRHASMAITLQPGADGIGEIVLEEFHRQWLPREYPKPFDECVAQASADWTKWLDRHPPAEPELAEARTLAAYINASCIVHRSGHFGRPAMLMSKHKMVNLWSWDHCFNAMAYATIDPPLAWAQFMLPFDHIDEHGGLPASFNDAIIHNQAAKPPVHGWALAWMMDRCEWIDRDHLSEIYAPLAAWTEWWFRFRRDGDERLPHADHGNDTGWDNATVFQDGVPITTPDIPAYLIVQMRALARVAEQLGDASSAARWRDRAIKTQRDLIDVLWVDGEGFIARDVDRRPVAQRDCLIQFMPLILGEQLDPAHARLLRDRLLAPGRFRTRFGCATESIDSPLYQSGGYWRGPIWAPPTLLLFDGLGRAGFEADALDLARDYLSLCAQSGFPENFDAVTGAPLRDPTYSWTASVFLMLLEELRQSEAR
jgi:putative isomerase